MMKKYFPFLKGIPNHRPAISLGGQCCNPDTLHVIRY